ESGYTFTGGKVLYFAGCMTQLTPSVSKAMVSLFEKAGADYQWMDADGGLCCGRPLLMAGRREPARELIEKNTEAILASGADTLVLSCPICCRVFRENYQLPGIRVLHHSEYLQELIAQGKLAPEADDTTFAYHDPCELGRGLGIYEAPRAVIESAAHLVEGAQHHKESVCCGGSIGSISLSYHSRSRITEDCLKSLTQNEPDAIATACPLCQNTFSRAASLPVMDIAQILDQRC
ncbi:MAG: (Fe-S)-binding protein, partial [Bacteroidales bacterium]|nr:(Fe-S)-binding protein [Bacteroidales bacterium]